jgi:hypothetical protein
MDDKVIKGALDSFENDDFIDAKDKLKGEISKAKDVYLKQKLGLEKDINPPADIDKGKITRKSGLTGK